MEKRTETAHNLQRRVVMVYWKGQTGMPVEAYSNLKNFCACNPEFKYGTLNNYLSKKKMAYETDRIRIERMPVIDKSGIHEKPDLPKRLFWEFRFDQIDWRKQYTTVIQRVIEWGNENEWNEIIDFYGIHKVIDTLKYKINYLPDYAIEKVCTYFHLQKEGLKCYIRKQSMPQHWI